jgi:ABC-2 type transport system permease protein
VSRVQAIRLVATREIVTRARSRAFLVSTALIAAGLVAVALLTGGDSGPTRYDVAGVGASGRATLAAAGAEASAFDAQLDVHPASSDRDARARVRSGALDAAVLASGKIAVEDNRSSGVVRLLQTASGRAHSARALRAAHVPPSARRQVLDPPPVAVVSVGGRERSTGDEGLAYLGALVLYVALLLSGYAVASGVTEEKQSRVVELVVAVMRPTDLLAGKVLGVGLVSLGQLVLVAVPGVVAARIKGSLEIPSGTALAIVLVIACFVLGYALYASLYAGAAALVDRQEDLQSAVMPFTTALIATYVLTNQALAHPEGGLATVLGIVPLSSPIVLPGRVALHAAGAGEVVLGLGLLVLSIPLAIALAGRLYRGGVLATGGRIKLGAALRMGREAGR